MSVKLSYTTSLPLQLQALATATTGQELVVHRTVLSVLYRVISHPLSSSLTLETIRNRNVNRKDA
jgi:hypothetical protein